ncbi:MAG TPA: DNA translocase FtsK 4TM domain-containing protein [bacterium]|nr:DNA translocase FtsK 4TM domain-containing protein [bacterium]HPL95701.1 DNA translocase FtsK 4TM domain-containing protein [bacterium]
MKKNNKKTPLFILPPAIKKDVLVVFIFALAFLSILSFFNLAGATGHFLTKLWHLILGDISFIIPLALILIGYLIINNFEYQNSTNKLLGITLFILSFSGLWTLISNPIKLSIFSGQDGGILGYLTFVPLIKIAGFYGALIILIAFLIIALLFFWETPIIILWHKISFLKIFNNLKQKFNHTPRSDVDSEDASEDISDVGFEQKTLDFSSPNEENDEENYAEPISSSLILTHKKKYPKIDLPLSLLSDRSSKPTSGDIKSNQEIIKNTLSHFGIEVEMGEVSVGPTVTQYTFKPEAGVKVAQITTLSNDLALALAAHPIRIEAPIPGKSLIGVEVPNQKIATVTVKEILTNEQFKNRESNLMMALGKDVAGKPWLANIDKMPHLLVAGATGSGKTVCLNAIIISLLYQNQPHELKLILIDPKQVEMVQYNDIPHLSTPVITNIKDTIAALRWAVKEMEDRFKTLSLSGKRNIAAYNQNQGDNKMPYLIIIIDELADLMTLAPHDMEQTIIRLAQKSRAVGIHLILATQRPSVNVITGLIKANITSRIAFSVASSADSRTILDYSGAEKLLGRGDMLYITADLSKPKRIQGAHVSDEEIEQIVNYLKQQGKPDYNEEITQPTATNNTSVDNYNFDSNEEEELLPEAKELIIKAGKASASYLQRRLGIGYARAARILDLLEEQGVIGPAQGSKPREILHIQEDWEQDEELHRLEQAHESNKKSEDNLSNNELN